MIEQGTDAWKALRCGKATASKMADLTARTKTGWGASRANYAAQLVAERLTGTVAESFTNAAMQWGTEKEPEARAALVWIMGQFGQFIQVSEGLVVRAPARCMSCCCVHSAPPVVQVKEQQPGLAPLN